jgi:16S rRNA (guanine966-N2)-methyltransferase
MLLSLGRASDARMPRLRPRRRCAGLYSGRVTRIIAGAAGSLTLEVPGRGTRPTSDRVRESIFGSLDAADAIAGARVLDLYAGSGALGLEALSRGATSVDLVEKSPRAASVIERNAQRVRRAAGGTYRVHRTSADAYLAAVREPYALVFIDPPYDLGEEDLAQVLRLLVPSLAPDAIVVTERAARSPEPVLPTGLMLERQRRYGDTAVWWLRCVASVADADDQPSDASQSR